MHSAINFSSTTNCAYDEIGRHIGLKIQALLGVPVRVWLGAPVCSVDTLDLWFTAKDKKTTRNCLQSIYDNVYDMITCKRLTKKEVAVGINNNENSSLKSRGIHKVVSP